MTRFKLLQQDFLAGKPITLPNLDCNCLKFFFEEDDILFKNGSDIQNMMFVYIPENDGYCPVIKCKMTYKIHCIGNIKSSADQYFIYDEIDVAISLNQFENRLEQFCNYIDDWIKLKYNVNINGGLKGLEISTLLKFIRDIGCMGLYLRPYEEIIESFDEQFCITDKKFA